MKRVLSLLVAAILLFSLMIPMTVSAASAGASLTGPATVRAGDTITLTFNLNGSGSIFGAEGTITYDSSQVSLVSTSQKIAAPWAVEFNGNKFVAYDNNLANPINKNTTLFTAAFKVKSVAVGTKINISCDGITATDGSADIGVGKATYSATVAAPLSGENNLAALSASGVTISSAFSAGTTSYTASVPFGVSKLDVSATPKDSKATVTISSPTLVPGGKTNVTVTVKAENGASKTYTIVVSREKDPNYVASDNNNLSGIKVEGFLLSPVFKADLKNYVVWVPYETESVTVSGTAADSKATVAVTGGDKLAAGRDNEVLVVCTAENGEKKTYTVVVKRAAAHNGAVDSEPENPTPETPTPDDEPTDTEPAKSGTVAWWWILITAILALAVGCVAGIFAGKLGLAKNPTK